MLKIKMPQIKRGLYLVHRWVGVVLCIVIALWFFSGIVMLYVGYPKLTPAERLGHMPDLTVNECCVPLDVAWRALPDDFHVETVKLSSIAGRPVYSFATHGKVVAVDAQTGQTITQVSEADALKSGMGYFPGKDAVYRGLVYEDQWSRTSRFAAHRPLHRVEMNDDANTLLYISSSTGEVVRDASLTERRFNYVGSWLHWLYMFRANEEQQSWRYVVVGASIIGVIVAITGTIVGILRWKFKGHFKTGSKTPYRESYMRWHHITGMLFAVVTITWLFSGLMSMNPWQIFSSNSPSLDFNRYNGGHISPEKFAIGAPDILADLEDDFHPREIEWRLLGGKPYLTAYNQYGDVRLRFASESGQGQPQALAEQDIVAAAKQLLPGYTATEIKRLDKYDIYYYARASHTLFGHLERPLPVLKVAFDNPDTTFVYVDLTSGRVIEHMDHGRRQARWFFSMLHSWDFPPLLAMRPLWDILVILFSLGGLALSVTGVVIAVRRLRTKFNI